MCSLNAAILHHKVDINYVSGNSASASRLAKLSGYVNRGTTFSSTGPSMYLRFVSDIYFADDGFQLAFSYLPTGKYSEQNYINHQFHYHL